MSISANNPDLGEATEEVEAAFEVDLDERQAICPQEKTSTQWSHIQDAYMGTEYYRIEWASQCDRCPVQTNVPVPKTDAESWWSGRAMIWSRRDAKKCASRITPIHASEKWH